MKNNVELIKLVINNYLDKIQLIINQDMVVLEYMYIINNEKDVYKTIEVTELEDKYCLKFYPEATTKIITLDEFSDIFDILDKQITKRRLSAEEVKEIENKYKPGLKVKLIKMYDLYAPPTGTIGTIKGVDSVGNILVNWENGSSLSLISIIDKFEIIE